MIALDIESDLISRPVAAPPPVCVSFADTSLFPEGDLKHINEGALDQVHSDLAGQDTIVGHNVSYDFCCLMGFDESLVKPVFAAYRAGRVQDTLLNQKLLDIASGQLKHRSTKGYDLGTVAERYGMHVDKEDPWRMRYGSLRGVALAHWPAAAKSYSIADSVTTLAVAQKQHAVDAQWAQKMGFSILSQAPARARFALALHLTGIHGLRTNAARVEALKVKNDRRLADLKARLVPTGLVRPSGKKNTKVAQLRMVDAWKALGKPVMLTDTGKEKLRVDTMDGAELAKHWKLNKSGELKVEYVSCDRDACILAGDETMVEYADYARFGTLVSRIEDLAHGVDLPLQPRYDSLKETGRSSASKGKVKKEFARPGHDLVGCQIQNFPRGEGPRECLEPREGNAFVLADYEAAELHSLAQVCFLLFGHSKLGELLNAGVDVHTWFAAQALLGGITYEEAMARLKAGDKAVKNGRQAAKAIVYGVPGGMGPAKLVLTARKSYGVKLTIGEAKRLRDLYLRALPELAEYFRYVETQLGGRKTGTIRHISTGFWRGGCSYSAMANHKFQHLTAQGALSALFEVVAECYTGETPQEEPSPLAGFRPVAFCHDEIVLEGPKQRAHEACMRLQLIMEREMNLWTPQYPTPAEPLATMQWGKNAKQVRDQDGRIVCKAA